MVHPVVRTHPETNERLIYVNAAFTDHIVDMEPEESAACWISFINRLEREVQCRLAGSRGRWRFGTIALANRGVGLS